MNPIKFVNGHDSSERLKKFGKVEIISKSNQILDTTSLAFEIGNRKLYNLEARQYVQWKARCLIEVTVDLGEVKVHREDEPDCAEVVKLNGTIPTICKLGDFPPQDLTMGSLLMYQDMVDQWATECGLNPKYFVKMRETSPPLMCALCAPSLDDESMPIFVLFVFTFFILDDTFDNVTDFWKEILSVADVKAAVDTFTRILNKDGDLDFENLQDNKFPLFQPMCKMLQLLRSKLEIYQPSVISQWLASVTSIFEAWAWETRTLLSAKRTNEHVTTLRKFYLEIRDSTAGMHICTELISIFKKISVSQRIRRDPLFTLTMNWMSRCVTLENDIFSFKKEIKCGEKANAIWIKGQKTSMQEALEKAIAQTAQYVAEIPVLQARLLRKYRHEADTLQKYFTTCNLFIDSGIQFYLLSQRYGQSAFSVRLLQP